MTRLIILLAVLSMACGMSAKLPTATPEQTTVILPTTAPRVEVQNTVQASRDFVVCRGTVNIRADAGTAFEVVREPLQIGERVTWSGQQKTVSVIPWYQVVTAGGIIGWVRSDYLCEVTK